MLVKIYLLMCLMFSFYLGAMDKSLTAEETAKQVDQMRRRPLIAASVRELLELSRQLNAEFSKEQLDLIGSVLGPLIQKEKENAPQIIEHIVAETSQNGRIRIKLALWFINSKASCLSKSERLQMAWLVALREREQSRIDALLTYIAEATNYFYLQGRLIGFGAEIPNPTYMHFQDGGYTVIPKFRLMGVAMYDKELSNSTSALPFLFAPLAKNSEVSHREYIKTLYLWVQCIEKGGLLPTDELWQNINMLMELLSFSGLSIDLLPCMLAVNSQQKLGFTRELISLVKKNDMTETDVTKALSLIVQGADVDQAIDGSSAMNIIAQRAQALDYKNVCYARFLNFNPNHSVCIVDLEREMEKYSRAKISVNNIPDQRLSMKVELLYEGMLNFSRPRCLKLSLQDSVAPEIFYAEGKGGLSFSEHSRSGQNVLRTAAPSGEIIFESHAAKSAINPQSYRGEN